MGMWDTMQTRANCDYQPIRENYCWMGCMCFIIAFQQPTRSWVSCAWSKRLQSRYFFLLRWCRWDVDRDRVLTEEDDGGVRMYGENRWALAECVPMGPVSWEWHMPP